jgi:hypothetical protein
MSFLKGIRPQADVLDHHVIARLQPNHNLNSQVILA